MGELNRLDLYFLHLGRARVEGGRGNIFRMRSLRRLFGRHLFAIATLESDDVDESWYCDRRDDGQGLGSELGVTRRNGRGTGRFI